MNVISISLFLSDLDFWLTFWDLKLVKFFNFKFSNIVMIGRGKKSEINLQGGITCFS